MPMKEWWLGIAVVYAADILRTTAISRLDIFSVG